MLQSSHENNFPTVFLFLCVCFFLLGTLWDVPFRAAARHFYKKDYGAVISASINKFIYLTVNKKFGDDITDTHLFTGSLFISGNLDAVNLTADSSSFSKRTTTLEAASSIFSSRITTDESEL